MAVTVLVVDDDAFALRLAKAVLEREGARVLGVSSWPEVNHAFFGQHVDLALVDVQMPSLSGDQLAKIIKQTPTGAKTPLILVSNLPESDLEEKARSARADGWMQKPVTTSKIRALFQKHALAF